MEPIYTKIDSDTVEEVIEFTQNFVHKISRKQIDKKIAFLEAELVKWKNIRDVTLA